MRHSAVASTLLPTSLPVPASIRGWRAPSNLTAPSNRPPKGEAGPSPSSPQMGEAISIAEVTPGASPFGGEDGGGLSLTRTQAGIRLAVEEHPDALFVFGNAPTALMELCDLIRRGKAHPAGIIAAPVGFVHVRESKHMVKPFKDIPKIIVEGRKGGSNLAATLCNAILTFDDAEQLKPGRDL